MRALGHYQLLSRLASGSLGDVFVARSGQERSGRAVKVIQPDLISDLRFGRLLMTEAKEAQRLQHPGAVVPLDCGREKDDTFVATRLVKGQPLAAILKHARVHRIQLDHRWLCYIGAELAEVLAAAHEVPWFSSAPAPMVHGGLSPRSVIVTYDGEVRVLGLGLGRARCALEPSIARLAYAAPERLMGKEPTPRTDIYALGVLLYEAFTGKRPFQRPSEGETRAAIREANVPPLHAGNLTVRLEVADLLQESMAPRVDARPGSMAKVSEVLRSACGGSKNEFKEAWFGHLSQFFGEDRENLERRLDAVDRSTAHNEWTSDIALPRVAKTTRVQVPDMDVLSADTLQEARNSTDRLGRYVLYRTISRSGPGVSYFGLDPNLERSVIIHTLDPRKILDDRLDVDTWVQLFKLEARYAGRLRHPRLPTLLDAGRHEERYFAVYRYLDGASLSECVERDAKLDPQLVLRMSIDWAEAIHALHECELVHGDIRATNLLVDAEAGGAVIDLSLAQPIDGTEHPLAKYNTHVHAPETLLGLKYSPRSEQFAFGAVLYEALVGQRPFKGDTDELLRGAIRQAQPRWPKQLGISLPEGMSEILERLLARAPADRFESFAELTDALRELLPHRLLSASQKVVASSSVFQSEAERVDSSPWMRSLIMLASRVTRVDGEASSALQTCRGTARLAGLDGRLTMRTCLVLTLARVLQLQGDNRSFDVEAFVPIEIREAVTDLLQLVLKPIPRAVPPEVAVAYLAYRYEQLARPPEGRGTHSPRRAVLQIRYEADARKLKPDYIKALVEHLRGRLSALDLSERTDERILVAGGPDDWRGLIEKEGFEVVRAADGAEAMTALTSNRGYFFGVVVDVRLPGQDGRALLRLGHQHPELREVRFALVGAELEPADHGPYTCAVPAPSPEAVRAVVRGWRTL